jgi:PAS domain S-box-containing protein
MIQLSHEPMFAWLLDGSIDFWNAGAEQLYGFSSEEAIGRSSHALLQTNFGTTVIGPANSAISVRMAVR